jgi:hypothetical protein
MCSLLLKLALNLCHIIFSPFVTPRDYTPPATLARKKKRPPAEEADYRGRRKGGKEEPRALKSYNKRISKKLCK